MGYGNAAVLRGLSLVVRPGQVLALAGRNGAGKTTLLRGLARLLRPQQGAVLLGGSDLWRLSERDTARRWAWCPRAKPPRGR